MSEKNCGCSGHEQKEGCAACQREEVFSYWCKSCSRPVPDKRCPYCGLKAQKKKEGGPG